MVATLATVDREEPGDDRGDILDIDGLRMRVPRPYGIGKSVHASAKVPRPLRGLGREPLW